jgi:hypothetical protein
MSERPFVEIMVGRAAYRFYGRGEWEISVVPDSWHPINAIYIPSEVLRVAALQWAQRGQSETSLP